MANNLKKKLIREFPVIARLQAPKYQSVRFLRSVNHYTNWRYPTERQLEVATQIMDDYDKSEDIEPLTDLSRKVITGKVVTIRRRARNKAYYNLLTVKTKDRYTYLLRETKALAGVEVGDTVTASAKLVGSSIHGTYHLNKPTKTRILN